MRTLLKALCLTFSIGVLAVLTTGAARGGDGCGSSSDGTSSQAAPQPQAPAKPAAEAKPAAATAEEVKPTPAPVPPDRFIGASKAGPVFLPPPAKTETPPQPQQQAR